MKLIVGLGNPGSEYARTRHNIGFDVLDRLAVRLGATSNTLGFNLAARSRFDGLAIDGAFQRSGGDSEKFMLLKPMTYMNLSGKAVQAAAGFFQLTAGDIMIVLDDLALPCGRIRLRPGGSDGGHNGLRDIQRALGTTEYPRLRIGIDPPPPPQAGKDYVLGRFTEAQRQQIDSAIDRAVEAIVTWMDSGITAAMNRFNVEPSDRVSDSTDEQ
jgi:PTH1 family peptidyl-tRNA hydrolase